MRQIQLVGDAYKDETLTFSAQDSINWIPEPDESGQGRSQWMLRGVPGLRSFTITISTLRVSGDAPNGTSGDAFSYSYTAAGGALPYRFSISNPPPGTTINPTTGVLSGTLGFAGAYNFVVSVTDGDGVTVGVSDSVTVYNSVGDPNNPNNPDPNNPDDPVVSPSLSGDLYKAYVNTPHYAIGAIGEGITVTGSGAFEFFSAGMPENTTITGTTSYGYPTASGTSSVTLTGGVLFGAPLTYSTSMEVLPSPSFTVFSGFDRSLQFATPKFLAGPAPYLQFTRVEDGSLDGYGFVRGINGRTTGKLYWETTVTTLPAGGRFGCGVDASLDNGLTYTTQQLGDAAGQWGWTQNGATAGAVRNGGFTSATAAAQGDVICCAVDLGANAIWIRVNGGTWIGGGNPAAGTSPTFSGLSIPVNSFWGDYRPCALAGIGVTLTANFGSSAFAFGVPAGFGGWPWAQVNEMRWNILDSDTIASASGDTTVFGSSSPVNPSQRIATNGIPADVFGSRAGFIQTGATPSILGGVSKSSGKWQFEVSFENTRSNRTRVGVVDSIWVNRGIASSFFPEIGTASGSLGVLPNSTPTSSLVPGFPAKVFKDGVEIGTFQDALDSQILTFACDFTANTVAVYREGVLGGTYSISGTGPWKIAISGFSGGGAILRTSSLVYPVATFADWKP